MNTADGTSSLFRTTTHSEIWAKLYTVATEIDIPRTSIPADADKPMMLKLPREISDEQNNRILSAHLQEVDEDQETGEEEGRKMVKRVRKRG